MDDLKLYAKINDDLERQLNTVKRYCDDIGMLFGLDKCAKVTFKKDSKVKSKTILDINREITELEHNKTYEYFGINEANGVNNSVNKKKNYKRILSENKSYIECKK